MIQDLRSSGLQVCVGHRARGEVWVGCSGTWGISLVFELTRLSGLLGCWSIRNLGFSGFSGRCWGQNPERGVGEGVRVSRVVSLFWRLSLDEIDLM